MKMKLFHSRLGRKVREGQLVGIHWNTHKKTFSIVEMKSRRTTGVVLGYADEVTVDNVSFYIEKSKRQKTRENKVKDRHAYVVGNIVDFKFEPLGREMYYNPMKVDTFVDDREFKRGNAIEIVNTDRASMKFEGKPVVVYLN